MQPVSGNPAVLEVTADGLDHEVRAVAASYLPAVRKIRFEQDLSLEFALEPEQPAEPVASPSQSTPSDSSGTAPAPPPRPRPLRSRRSSARCNPPFYFDNGIKTFKPECL